MSEFTLVFPHQLFRQHPAISITRPVVLVEEWLFFKQYCFHKQKLVLHRASMKWYASWLSRAGYDVTYIESTDNRSKILNLVTWLTSAGATMLHFADPTDNWVSKRLGKACLANNLLYEVYATPMFINQLGDVAAFFEKRKTYFQTDFYIHQRKTRKILIKSDGMPVGDKWTFDAENRLRFPRTERVPEVPSSSNNEFITEAENYVEQHFADNIGERGAPHLFVITHADADEWLDDFIANRLQKFGMYEDAIVAAEKLLYHAALTPMLNIGLLTPRDVLNKVLISARKYEVPINSLEGFVRQVMGWREFIRIVYEREGSRQRTKNYWQFTRKIPGSFWKGETGIAPVDLTIKKVLKNGYSHHIERLMVMGNFMLLCEFDPREVYRWFMQMYIDAYDWVMVPNVFGMTQFADGGLMTTKPYISGSNYLIKMGDYPKGEWQQVWDALFWRFMHVQRHFFERNPRLAMLLRTFDKWPADKRNALLTTAENYLKKLDDEPDNGRY